MRRVISAVRAWRVGAGSVRHSGVGAALPPLPVANRSNCCVPLRRSCRGCRWRHGPLPDSGRERPLLLSNQEHSMMRAQPRRRRSPSHRAMPAKPEARRHPFEGMSQPASARKPHDRTSKSAIPTIDPRCRRHGCSGPQRPPPSRSTHECERCDRPMDAKDKGPRAPRSYGRCLVALYNGRRPHSSLDRRTPDQAYFTPPPVRMAA